MIKITGNTYAAKELLKSAGFVYRDKSWYGSNDDKAELDRVSTASYSRTNQRLVSGLKFEVIEG